MKEKHAKELAELKGESTFNHDALVYEEIVVPILEEKCYSCHGPKKAKNGLRLDSIVKMIEGGDDDTALRKGDAANSPLITSIKHMPIEDDEAYAT